MRKEKTKNRKGKESYNIPLTVLLFALAVIFIFGPLYILFVVALKDPSEMNHVLALPKQIRWENFSEAWEMTDFPAKFRNTFVITAAAMALTIPFHSMISYALTRRKEKNRLFRALSYLLLCSLFIPFNVLMLPLVKQVSDLGMDNIPGIIVLYFAFGLPMNVFLYSGYVKTMPIAIDEAAIIDGAGPWRTFFSVIFPLMKPMSATVAILTFMWTWNDFLMPLVVLTDAESQTLQLAQYVFKSEFSTQYNLAFASYVLVLIPILLVYIFCQKWVIAGVTNGAVKA